MVGKCVVVCLGALMILDDFSNYVLGLCPLLRENGWCLHSSGSGTSPNPGKPSKRSDIFRVVFLCGLGLQSRWSKASSFPKDLPATCSACKLYEFPW